MCTGRRARRRPAARAPDASEARPVGADQPRPKPLDARPPGTLSPRTRVAGDVWITGRARRRGGGIRTRRPRRANQAFTQARGDRAPEKSARPRTLPPAYDPKFGVKNIAKGLRGAAAEKGTRGPQPARGGQARGSHARHSPVFWRQTRCEKERSRGLRHLYTVLPHPREEGGASTRHDFPSLPRATSTGHPFNRRPLPQRFGDRGRCALSPLKSTRRLAHAPLDPDDDESAGGRRGPASPRF